MYKPIACGFIMGMLFLSLCSLAEYLIPAENTPEDSSPIDAMVRSDLWTVLAEARKIAEESL